MAHTKPLYDIRYSLCRIKVSVNFEFTRLSAFENSEIQKSNKSNLEEKKMDGEDARNGGGEKYCFLLHIYITRDALRTRDSRSVKNFRNVIRKRCWHS